MTSSERFAQKLHIIAYSIFLTIGQKSEAVVWQAEECFLLPVLCLLSELINFLLEELGETFQWRVEVGEEIGDFLIAEIWSGGDHFDPVGNIDPVSLRVVALRGTVRSQ